MIIATRMIAVSTVFALFLDLAVAGQVDAAPFRPRPYSESSRLAAKDDCQLGGGSQFVTVYHYQFGGSTPTSATTTCHGGSNDGQTCEISGSNKQCTMPLTAGGEGTHSPLGGIVEQL